MSRRRLNPRAWLGTLAAAVVLAGCAAGSPRPTPAELPPNVDLIGVRQAWHAKLAPIDFPLQVHTQGSQVLLATGEGTVTIESPTAYSGKHRFKTTQENGRPEQIDMVQKGRWLGADCGQVKPFNQPRR